MKEIKFMIRYDQKGKEFTPIELYADIHKNLINKQVATHVTWRSDSQPPLIDGEIIHIEIPFKIKNDLEPNKLTVGNIRTALNGILDKYDLYSNLHITEEIQA